MIKKNKNIFIAIGATLLIMAIGTTIAMGFTKESKPKDSKVVVDVDVDIVSTSPEETAINFMYHAGTMGDQTIEATYENLKSGRAIHMNSERRINSYNKVKGALIPGSPLLSDRQDTFSKEYSLTLVAPMFYETNKDKLTVSKPYNSRNIDITSSQGLHTYNAVDVDIVFSGRKIMFDRPKDSSWDGTYTRVEYPFTDENLTMTLVELDGNWFVYELPESEEILNARLSTWKGIRPETHSEEKFDNGIISEND